MAAVVLLKEHSNKDLEHALHPAKAGAADIRALARMDRHRAVDVIRDGAVDVVLPAFPAWFVEAYCEELETSARRKRNAIVRKAQRN